MNKSTAGVLGALFLTLVTGCASEASNASESTAAVTSHLGGTADSKPNIGMVRTFTPPGDITGFCTAAVINTHVMLTAAHCAFDRAGEQVTDVDVSFAQSPSLDAPIGSDGYIRGKIVPNPAFHGIGGPGADVAYILLDQPMSGILYAFNAAPSVGDDATLVGYEEGTEPGTKRSEGFAVTSVSDTEITATKAGTCVNDTGGILFDGGSILGVTSWIDGANCEGHYAVITTDDVLNFIGRGVLASGDD